jgi:hypothetical protein
MEFCSPDALRVVIRGRMRTSIHVGFHEFLPDDAVSVRTAVTINPSAMMTLIVVLLVIIAPLVVHARDDGEVTIRLYDSFSMTVKDLHIAEAVTSDILARAGVRVHWRECRADHGAARHASDFCAEPLHPEELVVRLTTGPPERPRQVVALGASLVEVEKHAGTLATVFGDRVRELAADARVPSAILLGRAMAHEVGHLLLGTTTHAATGLMRAHWSRAVLRDSPDETWQFSNEEAARLVVIARATPTGDRATPQVLADISQTRLPDDVR